MIPLAAHTAAHMVVDMAVDMVHTVTVVKPLASSY
jgi:hypothetical protein